MKQSASRAASSETPEDERRARRAFHVPELTDLPVEQAIEAVRTHGLVPAVETRLIDEAERGGVIVDQDPRHGEDAVPGDVLVLFVGQTTPSEEAALEAPPEDGEPDDDAWYDIVEDEASPAADDLARAPDFDATELPIAACDSEGGGWSSREGLEPADRCDDDAASDGRAPARRGWVSALAVRVIEGCTTIRARPMLVVGALCLLAVGFLLERSRDDSGRPVESAPSGHAIPAESTLHGRPHPARRRPDERIGMGARRRPSAPAQRRNVAPRHRPARIAHPDPPTRAPSTTAAPLPAAAQRPPPPQPAPAPPPAAGPRRAPCELCFEHP